MFLSVCDLTLSFYGRKDSNLDDKRRLDDIPSLFREANRASVLLGLAEYKVEDAI
jgi:DNA-binding transcriptional regulator/RsmH inhibitor MraZ